MPRLILLYKAIDTTRNAMYYPPYVSVQGSNTVIKSSNYTFRMDDDLRKRLQEIADKQRRPLGNYLNSVLWEIAEQQDKRSIK